MAYEFPSRHPDGRVDWLILEGDVMIAVLLIATVVVFVYGIAELK